MQKFIKRTVLLASFAAISMAVISATSKESKLLRHVVLLKFKDGTTDEQVKQIENAFRKLPSQIKLIKSLDWGVNNSPEKLNDGFTVCFFLTFSSEKDRDAYLAAPAHKAFVSLMTPSLEKPLVIDYWAMR